MKPGTTSPAMTDADRAGAHRSTAPLVRCWQKVDTSAGPDGCWPWTGSRYAKGYGSFRLTTSRAVTAHRFVLESALGRPLMPGHFALHRCDNPPCCNPAHLWEGTAAANTQDMVSKGRQKFQPPRRGSANGFARLSEETVGEIRARVLAGETRAAVAQALGVSRSTAARAAAGRTWSHVADAAACADGVARPGHGAAA